MKSVSGIGLKDVQAVYGGPEGELWELVMGQQIHIGGFRSSMDLAEKAGIGPGMTGVDLCCCNGAGMRFLVRFRNVAADARRRCHRDGRRAGPPALPGRRDWPTGFSSRWPTSATPACPTAAPISSGAKTPGATWSTRPS